jgi:hypothetical protein
MTKSMSQIPTAFEWRPQRASWEIAIAHLTGWLASAQENQPHFRAEVEYLGVRYMLEVPSWVLSEKTLDRILKEKSVTFPHTYSIEVLICSHEKNGNDKRQESDAWSMRAEFLRLQPDRKALLRFLNKWGVWGQTRTGLQYPPDVEEPAAERPQMVRRRHQGTMDWSKLPPEIAALVGEHSLTESTRSEKSKLCLNYLFPAEMWNFREKCLSVLGAPKKPTREWFANEKVLPQFSVSPYPHYVLLASGCQTAIRNTITIDLLKQVRPRRRCARLDCRAPFDVNNRHRRKYCTPACAHLESVRRQRRRAEKRNFIERAYAEKKEM